jgi:hypothetical protein
MGKEQQQCVAKLMTYVLDICSCTQLQAALVHCMNAHLWRVIACCRSACKLVAAVKHCGSSCHPVLYGVRPWLCAGDHLRLCLVVVLLQASWIINAREPDERDITAAFLVFQPSDQLTRVLHSMPQVTGSLLCCICRTCVHFKSRVWKHAAHHVNDSG